MGSMVCGLVPMRIITQEQLDNDTSLYDDAVEIIRNDGLVCFPGHRQYSIAASLMSTDAVVALVQSKRRSGKAPSLILIPNESQLSSVAQDVAEVASALIQALGKKSRHELGSAFRATDFSKNWSCDLAVHFSSAARTCLRKWGRGLLRTCEKISTIRWI